MVVPGLVKTLRGCWSLPVGMFVVLFVGLLLAGRERLLRDPGTFWHTVVGERMLQTGRVIDDDPFSIRNEGVPWLAHQWLGECAMALLHRAAGLDGVTLGAATLLAAVFAWAAQRLRDAGIAFIRVTTLVVLAIGASSFHFLPRPHLVSIALLGWTFARLCDCEAGRRPVRSLAWIVPAFVLWSNVHGGALGGLATLGLVSAGWLVASGPVGRQMRHAWQDRSPSVALAACAATLACALATRINPFGWELPRTWIALMTSPAVPELIVEHARLSLREADGWLVLLFGAIYVGALARTSRAAFRVTWLVPLVWLALAVMRIRHGPLFAVTALVAFRDIWPAIRNRAAPPHGRDRFAADVTLPAPPAPRWRSILVPVLLVGASLLLKASGVGVPVLGAPWVRMNPEYWPVDLLPAVRAQVARGPEHARVLNDMLFGGYLIYHVPDARVWIDDRCELYGDAALREYVEGARDHPERIDAWADRADARTALVHAGSPFDRYLARSPRWRLVQRDRAAALFAREDQPEPPG